MKLSNLQKKLEKSEQYLPAEDTFFLADQLKGLYGNSALDIGCGSGYLTKVLKSTFQLVVGTDISFNTLLEQNYKTPNIICCNSADALNQKFDLIISNLPYLATDEIIDVSTDGGKDGLEMPIEIITSALPNLSKKGIFLFVTSSLSDYMELINFVKSQNFEAKILDKKKLFYEELIVIQVNHSSS
jgi:release factor glutamine methyltransferase